MKKIVILTFLGMTGCSTALPIENTAQCVRDLEAVPSANFSTLFQAALQSSACRALAADALNAILARVSAQHAARGMPR